LNDPFELPSLEEIEEMEKQRSQAIESLQIADHSVKCQKCGMTVPIVVEGGLARPHGNRITLLEHKIKWIETHPRLLKDSVSSIKQLKQELADLLAEEAKADKLRSLSLYSCRITGWKFASCRSYDKIYMYSVAKPLKQSPK
jgi:hypothetical protein